MSVDSSDALIGEIERRAGPGAKIAFVSGNFNVVHPGHLRLLRFAADCGDFLVVGVNGDQSEGAIVPQGLRLEGVRSISFVDFAFALAGTPEEFVERLRPAVVVKGKEHESHINPEQRVVDAYGGKLLFSSGDVVFSSVDLLRQEFVEPNLSSINKPLDYLGRHDFTLEDLKRTLAKYSGLRVAVIGDLIIDEYVNCDPLGMSQEDPTIVVTPVQQERFIGGAGIVAAHAAGLGAEVIFFSVCGEDANNAFVQERLGEYGVTCYIFEDESRPTTLKQRFRASGKTLLRVSHLRQHAVNHDLASRLLNAVDAVLDRTDLLVFSDFNYGCLPQSLVDSIVERCRARGVMMVADSQSSSQIGDVSRFKDMSLITPTEREARLAIRDFNSGLVVVAETLRDRSRALNVIVTLGPEGMLVHVPDAREPRWHTDRLPAMNTAPKDVAGAGDSLLCCASMALAVKADIWQSAYIGGLAAACQASRVGNMPLTAQDIRLEIES